MPRAQHVLLGLVAEPGHLPDAHELGLGHRAPGEPARGGVERTGRGRGVARELHGLDGRERRPALLVPAGEVADERRGDLRVGVVASLARQRAVLSGVGAVIP